jgi:hypothetical protein
VWSAEQHALEEVAGGDETWTFRFPVAYVQKLKQLGAPEIAAAASAWAATEEISGAASDVAPVIAKLVALARSIDRDRGLFVWTSL